MRTRFAPAVLAAALIALPAASPSAPAATVHIRDFAYVPAVVRVHAGDRVVFVNDDDEPHTVTAADGSFDSGGLDRAQRWEHVFTVAGRYAYRCEMHPMMAGTVVVAPAAP